jgi:hypothetical protein
MTSTRTTWPDLRAALESKYPQELPRGSGKLKNHVATLNGMDEDGFNVLAVMREPRAHLPNMETAPQPRSRDQAYEALKSLRAVAIKAVQAQLLDASQHVDILDPRRDWLSRIMQEVWPAPSPEEYDESLSDDNNDISAATTAPAPAPPPTPRAVADQGGPSGVHADNGEAPPPHNAVAPPPMSGDGMVAHEEHPGAAAGVVGECGVPPGVPQTEPFQFSMSDASVSVALAFNGRITAPAAIMLRAFAQAVQMRIDGAVQGITSEELATIVTGEDVKPWWSAVLQGSGQRGGWRHERCAPSDAAADDAQFDEATISTDALATGGRRAVTVQAYKARLQMV